MDLALPPQIFCTSEFQIPEKDGLPHVEAVEKLINFMLLDRIERKIDFAGRLRLADTIAATESHDCLSRFLQLRGLPVLNGWLQEAHKGKSDEGGSPKETDKPIEELILALLRALAKLPINLFALRSCSIGKSVNIMRSYKNAAIQRKAKFLVDIWKERVDGEMRLAAEFKLMGNGKSDKVETLRMERIREVVVEATGETTGGALALVVAESTSGDTKHLISRSPNKQVRRTITSWLKGEHIGSGSFGSVFEAIGNGGFFFAVKEVSLVDQGSNAKECIVQLKHEVSLLSRLEHDNIVQYYGTDKKDGKFYIFLELVSQGSLAALYQKYSLQDSQVSAYTRQILNGLNYLHQQNVLHRDIKCANLLVNTHGLVKLADFGLAKEISILSQAKSCKGTVYWMAPEVAKAKPHGPPADIWSLGCTVLEMLTGKVPYPDMEWTHALLKIGRGTPPKIPNTLSEDAQDFIKRCVQANPKDRPSASELLDHPFVQRSRQH